jgi:hypothetical protein
MTFTPSIVSKVDAHNTSVLPLGAGATFTGAGTSTTGYDTIVVTVEANTNSKAGGLEIQFSDDNATFTTFYSDSIFASIPFTNTYLIVKQYYRIVYTTVAAATTLLITTRVTPQLDSAALTQNGNISLFENVVEQTLDAFGKQRVTTPSTLLDVRFPSTGTTPQTTQNQLVVNTYVTAGGAWAVNAPVNGTLLLTATGAAPGVVLSQSRNFVVYQPGKSFLMLFSGVFKPTNNTYNSAVGLFDTDVVTPLPGYVKNGVYLSFAAGVPSVNITATGITTSYPQSAWNIDKMDGLGRSKLNLNFTNCQLFVIDLEWLGVGRVRFGFYAFGRIQYCHQVTNINALTGPYTPTMDLPISYMLWSAAPTLGATLTQICSTVISEGGYTLVGRPFGANTGSNQATQEILVNTTETGLLAIRGSAAAGYYHQSIVPTNFSVIDTDNNNTLLLRLRYYPARLVPGVTATTWSAASPYSVVEYAAGKVGGVTNITAFSTNPADSIIITSSYILGKGSNLIANLSTTFSTLLLDTSSDIENRPDILLLTAQRVGTGATTAKVWASIDWQEVI